MRPVVFWILLAASILPAAEDSTIVVSSVINAASNLAGPIAPGELVAITGLGLGPAQLVSAAPNTDGLYPTELAGTTVQINGTPALLIYTWNSQVAAVVPDSLAGETAEVTVTYQGKAASFRVPLAATALGIFTQDATGHGHAVTINQNGIANVPAHWEGDVMTLFVTGIGRATSPVTIDGFHFPAMPLSVEKGTVPGVMQIKLPILHGQDCDTPVVVRVGNAMSQPDVTVAVDLCI